LIIEGHVDGFAELENALLGLLEAEKTPNVRDSYCEVIEEKGKPYSMKPFSFTFSFFHTANKQYQNQRSATERNRF